MNIFKENVGDLISHLIRACQESPPRPAGPVVI